MLNFYLVVRRLVAGSGIQILQLVWTFRRDKDAFLNLWRHCRPGVECMTPFRKTSWLFRIFNVNCTRYVCRPFIDWHPDHPIKSQQMKNIFKWKISSTLSVWSHLEPKLRHGYNIIRIKCDYDVISQNFDAKISENLKISRFCTRLTL